MGVLHVDTFNTNIQQIRRFNRVPPPPPTLRDAGVNWYVFYVTELCLV